MNQAKDRLDNAASTIEDANTRSSTLRTDLDRVSSDLQKADAGVRDLLAQQQNAFNQAETDRTTRFNQLITEKTEALDTTVAELGKSAEEELNATRKKTQADKEAIEKTKTEAEKLLGIIGEGALIGRYSINAKRDRGVADFWRWVAAGSVGIAIVVAGWLAISVGNGKTDWKEFAAKVVLVASFGGLAGYAAQQSSEHRKAQRRYEETASQLAALRPYLQDISDKPIADKLLSEVGPRFFGPQGATPEISDVSKTVEGNGNPMPAAQLITLIQQLVSKLK